jgi:hypothetical protein
MKRRTSLPGRFRTPGVFRPRSPRYGSGLKHWLGDESLTAGYQEAFSVRDQLPFLPAPRSGRPYRGQRPRRGVRRRLSGGGGPHARGAEAARGERVRPGGRCVAFPAGAASRGRRRSSVGRHARRPSSRRRPRSSHPPGLKGELPPSGAVGGGARAESQVLELAVHRKDTAGNYRRRSSACVNSALICGTTCSAVDHTISASTAQYW